MSAFAQVWAQVALAVTWQLAVLAVVALAGGAGVKLREPRVRHALWWFVLIAPLVLAPGRMVLGRHGARVPVEVLPSQVVQWDEPARAALEPFVDTRGPEAWPELQSNGKPVEEPWKPSVPEVFLTLWSAGVVLGLVRLGVGWRQVRELLRGCKPIEDEEIAQVVKSLCTQAGVRGTVSLMGSGEVGAPLLYGVRRPVLVLPEGWLGEVPAGDLELFLAHEVAHVVRRDTRASLLQRVLEVLLFFHPAAWLASRRVSAAREELCDAWALARGGDAYEYANALTSAAARSLGRLPELSVGLAENRFVLLRRVEAIFQGQRRRTARAALVVLLTLGVVTAGACAVAHVAQRTETQILEGDGVPDPNRAKHEKAWLANQDAAKAKKVTFSGRVVDSAGRPAGGVELWLYVGRPESTMRYAPLGVFLSRELGNTGAGGKFRVTIPILSNCVDVPAVGPWDAVIVAHDPSRGMTWAIAREPEATRPVSLRLEKPVELRARIVGPGEKPMAKGIAQITEIQVADGDASHRLNVGGGPEQAPAWTRVRANVNGEVTFSGLPARGAVQVNTTLAGQGCRSDLVSYPMTIDLATQRGAVTLPFGAPIVIAGDLKKPNGEVASKVRVRLTGEWRKGEIGATTSDNTWSDENGHFRFELSQPATYTITVQDQNLYGVLKDIKVTALGQQVHLPTTTLQTGGSIEGRVINSATKQPVMGVPVFCRPDPDPNPALAMSTETASTTDAEGRYYLSAPPGKVDVYANPQQGWGTSVRLKTERADGREQIRLVSNRAEPWEKHLEVTPNQHVQGLDLYLAPMVPVSGIARDAEGKPIAGAHTNAWVDTSALVIYNSGWYFWSDTKEDGSFKGFGYPGVPIRVVVVDPKTDLGGVGHITPNWPKAGPVSVVVRRMVPVRGRVLQSNGKPAAGASVDFSYLAMFEKGSVTDQTGRFERPRGIPGISFTVGAVWPPYPVARRLGKSPDEMGRSKDQRISLGARSLEIGDIVMEPREQLVKRWEKQEKEWQQ